MVTFAYLTQYNLNYGEEHTVPILVNPERVIALFPVEKTRSKPNEPSEKFMTTFIQYAAENEHDYGGYYVVESLDQILTRFRGSR